MDVGGRFLAAGNVEITTARRAAPHEHRVPTLGQQRLEAVDAFAALKLDTEIEDVIAFLVDDGFGQAKARDLRADHAARLRILVEHDAVIAEWGEIPRDRERGGAAAHERNALAVLDRRRLGQALADIVLEVGGDPFEPTDRDRLVLHAHAPAGRLAGPVAGIAPDRRYRVPLRDKVVALRDIKTEVELGYDPDLALKEDFVAQFAFGEGLRHEI